MHHHMKCDIYMENDIYYIEADIPGYNKQDIKVHYNDNNLIISAQKVINNRHYLIHERYRNHLSRSFYLQNIDVDLIEAKYENGVLYIVAPLKKECNEKKKIEIK